MSREKAIKVMAVLLFTFVVFCNLMAKTPVIQGASIVRKPSVSKSAKLYIQPQIGMGYSLQRGSSIAILGSYVGMEINKFRIGFSGAIGASMNYFGVQLEKMITLSSKESLTIRVGNFGRLSSNIGFLYENREGNVSFIFGPEICTKDIVTMGVKDISFAATVGLGFKGK